MHGKSKKKTPIKKNGIKKIVKGMLTKEKKLSNFIFNFIIKK